MKKNLVKIKKDGKIYYAVRRKRLFREWEYKSIRYEDKWISRSEAFNPDFSYLISFDTVLHPSFRSAVFAYFDLPTPQKTIEKVIG